MKFSGLFNTLSKALTLGLIPSAIADSTNLDTNKSKFPTLPTGFEISLFASEPLIRNPTCLAFDRKGRAFVAQGPQFRKPRENTPGDTINILVDRDNDGVADDVKIFAQGFNSIHGLAWKGNDLYVANAPDFTVVRDTDGDDIADEYIKIYTDLGNLEHSLHGLNWAPDGKLYMSKGNSKGLTRPGRIAPKPFRDLWGVESPKGSPQLPPAEKFTAEKYKKNYHHPSDDWGREGGILRCDPMGKNLEITSRGFRNPWDMAMDNSFNFLGTDNDQNDGDKIFMPFYGAHFGWGHSWSYNWTDSTHLPTAPHSGPFFNGSGTGVIYYSLDRFPPRYRNVFFINDWGRKCTYVMRPRWNGALLQSDTGNEPLEIFADSKGSLFKPSDIEVGPDGALWVLSWGNSYGATWDGEPKLENQKNEGRIFRIWHHKNPPYKKTEWLSVKRLKPMSKWSLQELVDDLDQAIPSWRTEAQGQLIKRNTSETSKALIRLTKAAKTQAEETWLIWTLAQHETKDPKQNIKVNQTLLQFSQGNGTLNQKIQSLRAIRLRLAKTTPNETNEFIEALSQALEHKNPRIRFAALQTIWQARLNTLTPNIKVLTANEKDRLTFYAAWGALRDMLPPSELRSMLQDKKSGVRLAALLALLDLHLVTPTEAKTLVNDSDPRVTTVAALYLSKIEREMANLLLISPKGGEFVRTQNISIKANIKDTQIRYTLDGSEPNGRSKEYNKPFAIKESTRLNAAMFRDGERVGPLVKLNYEKIDIPEAPTNVVQLNKQETQRMVQITGGLSEGAKVYLDRPYKFKDVPETLMGATFLMSRNDDSGSRGDKIVNLSAMCLLDVYIGHDRRIAPVNKPNWLKQFNATEMHIKTSDAVFDLFHRRFEGGDTIALGGNTTDGTDSGKSNYITIFSQAMIAPQSKPLTEEQVLVALEQADADRGKQIFYNKQGPQCSTCHQINGIGKNFGPELSGIGSRENTITILKSILQPNARLVEGYRTHIVKMKNGETYAGMALEESGLTFKLGLAAGQSITLEKKLIDNRSSLNTSPMPSTFSMLMNAQQMADLTAFLVSCKEKPRSDIPESKIDDQVNFVEAEGQIEIRINSQKVGTYVYNSTSTIRPFFKNIRTLSGTQVTRNHPPIEGADSLDHASMHPGIWMAFGDISGFDFWRNKAKVIHQRFITKPNGGKSIGTFSVLNRYETKDGKLICQEEAKHIISLSKGNWQLKYDSHFSSPQNFYFGDQEEMGLGVRLATPLIEKNGGLIRNSNGQLGAKETWGEPAIWCDYSGEIDSKWVGITILANTKTPRIPWWHNRNYGLMVANQFGRGAMKQGKESKLILKADEKLQLSFTIIIHENQKTNRSNQNKILKELTQ
ncbi:MAG: PVC-type heme-binding CxxCH protein [Verrucomicrobiota bacterium]|nr:PVC-type heme-binding CxxCH protein [Verrucomicrobiota bacterium]